MTLNGSCFKKLVQLGSGQSVQDYIIKLKARNTSRDAFGAKGGPTKSEVEELQRWSKGVYMCGSKVPGDNFYVQRKLFCADYIESQYYNHLGGKKAKNSSKDGRLVTVNICAI